MPARSITVVIPVGGVDELVEPQLRAVLAQSDPSADHAIAVLNSSDGTARSGLDEIVQRIGDQRLQVVVATERRSASYARNVGARATDADVLVFCDADDLVHDGWLGALVESLDSFDAVGGRLDDVSPDGAPLPKWRPPATPGALPTFLGVPYVVTANLAMRRADFDAVGGFDETLTRCEDIAISWRLLQMGRTLGFAGGAGVDYRVRGSMSAMLRQHHLYGIGMSEVLVRIGRPGDDDRTPGMSMLKPNNQKGGLASPVAVLRKAAIATGRVRGLLQERRRPQPAANGSR